MSLLDPPTTAPSDLPERPVTPELEIMLRGDLYYHWVPPLPAMRASAAAACAAFNSAPADLPRLERLVLQNK